jgi:hypothetical protein
MKDIGNSDDAYRDGNQGMKLANWNWSNIDEIVASFARPWQQYACSGAVAFSALWSTITGNVAIAAIAIPAAAALAGGSAYLRSVDKKTAAATEVANSKPSDNTVTAEIK